MKTSRPFLSLVLLFLLHTAGRSQQTHAALDFAAPDDQRISVIKASLALTESHETAFWTLYEQYQQNQLEAHDLAESSLIRLTRTADSGEAATSIATMLEGRGQEVAVRKAFFDKIHRSTNGTVALQFLQGEALFELLRRSRIYDYSGWERPQWSGAFITDEQQRLQSFGLALGMATGEGTDFRKLYEDYDFDYSRAVGHELVWFEQYIESVEDLTPGQCAKLGKEFIRLQEEEIALQQTYFRRVSDQFGPQAANRFITVSDYFSVMSKLKVWSDYMSSVTGNDMAKR